LTAIKDSASTLVLNYVLKRKQC